MNNISNVYKYRIVEVVNNTSLVKHYTCEYLYGYTQSGDEMWLPCFYRTYKTIEEAREFVEHMITASTSRSTTRRVVE